MRKCFIPLITFVLSIQGWAHIKSQENDISIDNSNSNLYLDSISSSGMNRRQHFSHGSAHHYSAVTYAKSIKTNLIKDINKSKAELQKINKVLSLEWTPSDGTRVECRISQISYVDLLFIDKLEINKRCYMITFISEYFSESSHSHTYYTYYFAEDGTKYYRTAPYVKSGEIDELKWVTNVLELIK